MQPEVMFALPYPPSVNTYWRHRVFGRRPIVYVTDAGIQYREAVKNTIKLAEPITGNLSVTVYLYPPDKRKRDIDNPLKALLDAMTHAGAWADDSQIKQLRVEMMAEVRGQALISIRPTGEGHG